MHYTPFPESPTPALEASVVAAMSLSPRGSPPLPGGEVCLLKFYNRTDVPLWVVPHYDGAAAAGGAMTGAGGEEAGLRLDAGTVRAIVCVCHKYILYLYLYVWGNVMWCECVWGESRGRGRRCWTSSRRATPRGACTTRPARRWART